MLSRCSVGKSLLLNSSILFKASTVVITAVLQWNAQLHMFRWWNPHLVDPLVVSTRLLLWTDPGKLTAVCEEVLQQKRLNAISHYLFFETSLCFGRLISGINWQSGLMSPFFPASLKLRPAFFKAEQSSLWLLVCVYLKVKKTFMDPMCWISSSRCQHYQVMLYLWRQLAARASAG